MKRIKSGKKIFSAIAALAISATVVGGAVSLINKGDKVSTIDSSLNGKNVVAVDTAIGTALSVQSGATYYVAPEAISGDTTADGSKAHPYFIGDILSGSTDPKLQAGDTVYVLPGTYMLNSTVQMKRTTAKGEILVKGAYNKYIRIVNAALEGADYDTTKYPGTEAVLDFSAMSFASTNRGVSIDTDYVYWYGIDICGAGDNGMYIGGSYNTIEYSEFYNNRDTGLQLGRTFSEYASIYQWPSYNLIKNCTSHNNYDNETFGENADGFAAKLTVGFGNVFDGCVAYRNSDDGWDLYAKTDSGNIGTVIMYNCVAFENGYLEYSRDVSNSIFPTYDKNAAYHKNEKSENPYTTRDGDGNGFKLGGSIMEGDVILYNCLSFNNRMHGVTDNSNPGYIKSSYVTSYNNSAAVDMNGNVAAVNNFETHANIDVSRQTYSYNSVNNVLSVRDNNALSLEEDNYRGTIVNSLLDATSKTNVIKGSVEADTLKNLSTYTSQIDLLVSSEIFKALPNNGAGTLKGNGDSMNYGTTTVGEKYGTTGNNANKEIGEISSMKSNRVHVQYRNADHSINFGDILDKKDAAETKIQGYLDGETAGSNLDLTSWADYKHFYANDFVNGDAATEERVWVERAVEYLKLSLNTVEDAVYQDFEVPVKVLNADIEWSTKDTDYLVIKDGEDDIEISGSGSEYALVEVWRPQDEDKQVTLTATVTNEGASETVSFKLTLKRGDPSVGKIYVEDVDGNITKNKGDYIVDKFDYFLEPEIRVQNGLYPDSNKLLKEDEYTVKSTYTYQTDANANSIELKQFTPSAAGVYTITHEVALKSDPNNISTMTYKVYVASLDANVAFTVSTDEIDNTAVVANRGGYAITGKPSSATGIVYTVTSETELKDLKAENIQSQAGVVSKEFRTTNINYSFDNANNASYYVYYALANLKGEITSKLYTSQITRVNIDSESKFKKIAGGKTIDKETPSRTIYALTKNLSFSSKFSPDGSDGFEGVLNGLGHTISNLSSTQHIFAKVSGGTIMNLKVDNLTITTNNADTQKVGFVGECAGGDFYNLAFTNVSVSAQNQRVGGLIGLVGKAVGDLTISQVSIVNADDSKSISGSIRVGGLIGLVQNYGAAINIDNCYVVANITATGQGEGGGMVATWEDLLEGDELHISQCYYSGMLKTPAAPGSSRLGGMLGYHKGGNGVLEIERCISLAQLHIQDELRDVSVKNASPIVGNGSSSASAVVSVRYCIGLMEEYNSDYDVQVFTEYNLETHPYYLTGEDYLNLDTERWTICVKDKADPEDDDEFYAPYAILKFLGEWD